MASHAFKLDYDREEARKCGKDEGEPDKNFVDSGIPLSKTVALGYATLFRD